MDKQQLYDEIIKSKIVEKMVHKVERNSSYVDDVINDIYIVLFEMDPDTLIELYNKNEINYYISRIVTNQVSKCGQLNKKYKKWESKRISINEEIL